MELLKYIKDWYQQVPILCKEYLTTRMAMYYPGLPDLRWHVEIDAMPIIFKMMEHEGHTTIVGYVTAFIGCMDFTLCNYDQVDNFLEEIEWDKQTEQRLISVGAYEIAKSVRKRIDRAEPELEARKYTVASWEQLKEKYLNPDYLNRYIQYSIQDYVAEVNNKLWDDIKKGDY